METVNLRFTIDRCADIQDLLDSDSVDAVFTNDDSFQVIIKDVDDVLIESLGFDELAEFFGIDSEFLIATEVLEFA